MSAEAAPGVVAIVLVTVATLGIGAYGLRLSRTTSDFLVASRTVHPRLNASAIGGEYLSAASFLGVAGLLLVSGADMLWYPIGWTAGFLVLLTLVAAPLRRSGAYTLPDFAEARLGSRRVRGACVLLVVVIGWLYLLPQFQGAGLTLAAAVGAPTWVGPLVVGSIVLVNVTAGGMRSITFVQAFQYWLKLTALLVPAAVLAVVWLGDGRPTGGPIAGDLPDLVSWSRPLAEGDGQGLYVTYSVIVATFLGTMGLPHVVVRFYTNPDGRAARRTTLTVLLLLSAFYLVPPVYGALGRVYAGDLARGGSGADTVVLELPRLMLGGTGGELLTGLVVAGAFAAFLSTSSGLSVAVAGVLTQDVVGRGRLDGVRAFRLSAVVAVGVPCATALVGPDVGVARTVGLAFAVAASTFCPLLLLGIWWRGLTPAGALAGLGVGGLGSFVSAVLALGTDVGGRAAGGWVRLLLEQPAAWSVPLALATMVLVSRATADSVPAHAGRFLVRLHAPEAVVRP
ncbi:cation acetate symporter [Nocardioides sp. TRM66260-LWL]|uniref:sodium/solute symporter n=1 Tax=Nocardioides sp. TRM66260-LWL TaxID=2874478 RepID=UPI001CC3D696|nr:cation acetate symporter [Nocardioides sp. TRM66260-LWL]MBZ5736339.1 cation acetate symporter [Nocardioides sp. TRM66260-LWL]